MYIDSVYRYVYINMQPGLDSNGKLKELFSNAAYPRDDIFTIVYVIIRLDNIRFSLRPRMSYARISTTSLLNTIYVYQYYII